MGRAAQVIEKTLVARRPRKLPFHQWPDIRDIKDNEALLGKDMTEALKTHPSAVTDLEWWMSWDDWHDETSGLTIRIPATSPGSKENNPGYQYKSLSFYADVYFKGKAIGDIGMSVLLDPEGNPEIRLGLAELRKSIWADEKQEPCFDYMGKGFTTRFLQQVFGAAKKEGAKRVSLHAVHAGSYAWAKMGFQMDPRCDDTAFSTNEDLAQWMLNRVVREKPANITDEEIEAFADELNEVLSSDKATPLSIAQCGAFKMIDNNSDGGPAHVSLGRWAITREEWNGVLEL